VARLRRDRRCRLCAGRGGRNCTSACQESHHRKYFFVALIVGLGAANLAFHLAMAGAIDVAVDRWLRFALDIVLFVMVVMGGRVIPMFTANAVLSARLRRLAWVEGLALGGVLALLPIDLVEAPGLATAFVACIAALAHGARLAVWQPRLTAGRPILWILHASYAWIAIYLALRALAAVDLVPANLATHALTVGGIGGLTLGMMTRVALGHTGRPLVAGRCEMLAYVLVQAAAVVVGVLVPLVARQLYLTGIVASGFLWSAAFALFTMAFWSVLVRPRIDGRSG
jgi:uncharacterized protein involved in response to NO